MPTYDYRCTNCGETFTKLLKIVDREQPTHEGCPMCDEKTVEMLVGGNYAFMSPEALGRKKPPEDFRELLRRIKKANPKGHIKDR